MMAGTVAITGANDIYFDGLPLLVIGPEHAATIAKDGYSKADVKKFIYEHGRIPLGNMSDEVLECIDDFLRLCETLVWVAC